MAIQRLLIIGNPEAYHIGAHFLSAATQLGLEVQLMDVRESYSKNVWVNRIFYRLGKRPAYLEKFSRKIIARCRELKPDVVLVSGISAPSAATLGQIRKLGIHCANYLTDDPWNPRNGANFFWPALREYDSIWSPRRANMEDLRRHGCRRVDYLPFAYNPKMHFPETPQNDEERGKFECEVAIIGGADADRIPIATALARAGYKLKLYGGYWNRHSELRRYWRGFVHNREFRLAARGGLVNICMGRKANRDGHAMRSLELPAVGACLVVEDTAEHRDLFGGGGDCVEYYSGIEEMVSKVKALCAQPEHARALGKKVNEHICTKGRHTYADRLFEILNPR